MDISKKILGVEHSSTFVSIANLALIFLNQGRWKEAEKLQVQVIGIEEKILGIEHLFTLISIANLALMYRDQRWWKEAKKLEV